MAVQYALKEQYIKLMRLLYVGSALSPSQFFERTGVSQKDCLLDLARELHWEDIHNLGQDEHDMPLRRNFKDYVVADLDMLVSMLKYDSSLAKKATSVELHPTPSEQFAIFKELQKEFVIER